SAHVARYLERRSRHRHHPRRAERRRAGRTAHRRVSRRVRGAGLTGIGSLLMQHTFVIAEIEHEGWLSRRGDGYVLHISEKAVPVALADAEGGGQLLSLGADISRVLIAPDGDFVHVHLDGATYAIRYLDPVKRYGSHAGGSADDIA